MSLVGLLFFECYAPATLIPAELLALNLYPTSVQLPPPIKETRLKVRRENAVYISKQHVLYRGFARLN